MSTSIVTGGAGFIGSHVTAHLLKMGHKVIVLDDLSGGFRKNIPANVTFIQNSIVNHLAVKKLFSRYQFDYVYHFAAYAAEGLSHFIKRFNYMNNLVGSVNLINESVKNNVKCFVFTSSIAVYGKGQVPMTEDMVPLPEDSYGIAKLAVEQELKITHEMFGLNYIIFRPHNVYGEYQNIGDRYRNVVGIFMNQLIQKKPLTVFGDGSQTRAFTYIGDIAPAIANSVNIPEGYNEVFNIGGDEEISINELAREIMNAMSIKGTLRYFPPRKEVFHAYSDHRKIKKIFGKTHSTSLPEGLKKMAIWVKKNGARKTKRFKKIEITENLPPVWLED